jgi:hypothetical protein
MDLDKNTLIVAAVLGAALLGEMRLLRRELKIFLAALMERSRRRDQRQRRESERPQPTRRRSDVHAIPEPFEAEDTDIHVLMDLERANQRTRRQTGKHERSPRPGTHHDR